MKTLADLKRNIKVGTRLHVVDHWISKYVGTSRMVTKVQGNGFWFLEDGGERRSWSPFVPRSQVQFLSSDTYRVDVDAERHWTLKIENP